jgi:putative DNA primase/helicase
MTGIESASMATITLQTIARALGGEVAGRQVLAPGPGHSPRDRSLAVRISNDAPDGFICFSHAGDDWRECRDYVREKLRLPSWEPGDGRDRQRTIKPREIDKWDFSAIDSEVKGRALSEDDLIRIGRSQIIWCEAVYPRRTAVADYFHARALDMPEDLAGTVLRFHPKCPWRNEDTGKTDRIPCLIVPFRSIVDDAITAIHRIRVDQPARWPKTDRRMLGVVHGAAVKLAPASTALTIGEGVETCMAATQLGLGPAWALGSVGAISFFPVIDGITRLTILAEAGEANARAIQVCARRWRQAGRRVFVSRPSVGSDHNDILMQRVS